MPHKLLRSSLLPLATSFLLLLSSCADSEKSFVSIVDQDGRYDFATSDGKTLLSYQHAVYPAPEGVDPAFARSGFIHPVNTLAGQLLTRIQPDDHYHHYGIWNPWTHTSFRGKEVDFWNLKKKQGTVRFAGLEQLSQGPEFAAITVLHEHVAFNEDGSETIALLENQRIQVSASERPDRYYLDISSSYQCGTDEPFTIVEYRYGGMCWRGPASWNHENSSILTSEGITREGADGSRARWVLGQGPLDGKTAGIAILSHPSNYNSPTPLRVWEKANHYGETFINMAPTKTQDWRMEPGETYTLRYRMIVYSGEITAAAIDAEWETFASEAP
ncbi:PmoA family protein [Pelagicoccus sp. NFK12]|uniref:PmoA family protein n=1 Tax=Pelagicoccus enzymogenes TaxID=2773457 RepID=A0A927F976_9BACT|nr:PmoA family protein [Pelagicoccus enzymogenes]MBD5780812.1 PmoA family protein [Pelagicoccus enzymogenes]MDQ8200490.1 PmoA family protein [Pelagicoccus enzymogenes]